MRYLSATLIAFSMAVCPLMVGCDRTVSHHESTDVSPNGTVKQEDTTVKQQPNGDVVKEQTKTVDKP